MSTVHIQYKIILVGKKPVRMRSIRDPAGMLYQTLLTKKRGFDLSVQAAVYLFRRSSKRRLLGHSGPSSLLERWLPALMYSCAEQLDTGKRFTGVFQTKILLLSFSAAMQEYIRLGFHGIGFKPMETSWIRHAIQDRALCVRRRSPNGR